MGTTAMTSMLTTEIAHFDRMVVSVYANDHGPAHVHVVMEDV